MQHPLTGAQAARPAGCATCTIRECIGPWRLPDEALALLQVSAANPQGRHIATAPTFFYLPHCELELTEALLAANVAAGTLGNVAILGNSFALYRERWELTGGRGARKEPPPGPGQQTQQAGNLGASAGPLASPEALLCDLCRCGAVEERAIAERGFPVSSAFNDMALHVFRADWRERLARQRGL